jgi:hypothetical protein
LVLHYAIARTSRLSKVEGTKRRSKETWMAAVALASTAHVFLFNSLLVATRGPDFVGADEGGLSTLTVALVSADVIAGGVRPPIAELSNAIERDTAAELFEAVSTPLSGAARTVAPASILAVDEAEALPSHSGSDEREASASEAAPAAADESAQGAGRLAMAVDPLWPYVAPCWRRLGGPEAGAGALMRVALGRGGVVLQADVLDAAEDSLGDGRARLAGQRALRAVLACGPYPQLAVAPGAAPLTVRFAPE